MKAMEPPEGPRRTTLRKWGPLAGVIVVVAVIAGFLIVGGRGGDSTASDPPTTADSANPVGTKLPRGVMPYGVAKARGQAESIQWGKRCDTTKGVLALPVTPPPECFKPYTGDNGGATSMGITATTVKVVVYLPQANDPILSFIYRQIGNTDTPDQIFATYQRFNGLMATYYETYGRKVELVRYDATGTVQDEVAATSDAETIARDIRPFMVIGGPLLTEAFADTLASNKVMCVSCTPGQPNDWYAQRGPYVWDIQKNSDQNQQLAAEYIGKRVAGAKASFGGDAVRGLPRQLGLIYLSATPQAETLRNKFTSTLKDDYGVEFAEIASYTDPVALASQAREILARMKSKGVTTIVFNGDPLAPQTLTTNATEQNFFPEWVMTGSALVDTTVFSRTYDQAQWARAFGPSNLFARTDTRVAGSGYLYRWFYGEDPPAAQTALILPNLQLLYGAAQGAGPDLTPQTFRAVLFGSAIIKSTVLAPQISWGNQGVWPAVDYAGLDDQTEVWWNPTATGPDELGKQGTGMWEYVDGGKRYLPGAWPKGQPKVFNPDGAVALYTKLPAGITLPDYRPLAPAS